MSFMFNPSPYDEPSAVMMPALSDETKSALVCGVHAAAAAIARDAAERGGVYAFEGYAGAEFTPLVNLVCALLKQSGKTVSVFDASSAYADPSVLEERFAPLLPTDREKDPVLLFGRRIEGGYENVFDPAQTATLLAVVRSARAAGDIVLLYGRGCTYSEKLRAAADRIVYLDIIPKEAVLRAKSGRSINVGDMTARPFKEMMRRNYYVDFELALGLRTYLVEHDLIDFYVDSTKEYKLLPREAFQEICASIAARPFRPKPVYLEGVWGGQYVKKLRGVPDEAMKNIAWVFDFIPMEVSVCVAVGETTVDIPFYTLLRACGSSIMGEACERKFGGYFPIRFNYDDTFHSSGNMSIQVHSGADYNRENYNEFGRQDESYYVVAAGHGARTYLGFRDDCDPEEFLDRARTSEREHTPVDYQKYVNYVESKPGVQVMIPAGTIHASGRNQVILEIGSLTIGSYTYKLYDYLRPDLDGKPRPIHTYHGSNVLRRERNASWVKKNICVPPAIVREGVNTDGSPWNESVLGEHDLLYFSLRHLEFDTEITDDTAGRFHVLSLVDGEEIRIEPLAHPENAFTAHSLDIVCVPASVGPYRIVNLRKNHVIVHKTMLKDGFEHDESITI